MDKIKLVIVDDHEVVIDGIHFLLKDKDNIEIVGKAGCGEELNKILENQKVDIIILDIALPGKSGIEITEQLKVERPNVKIIIFSGQEDEKFMIKAIRAGASGFLPKTTLLEQLEDAIEKVYAGEVYLDYEIPDDLYFKLIRNEVPTDVNETVLSNREIEVLKLLVDGLLSKQIGDKLNISTRTVEKHKGNMMRKIKVNSTIGLVKYAIKTKIVEI